MTQPPRYVPVPLPRPAEATQTDRSAQKASKAPQTNPEKRTRGAQTNRWGPTGILLMLPRERPIIRKCGPRRADLGYNNPQKT